MIPILSIIKTHWQGDPLNAPALAIPYFDVWNLEVDLNTLPAKWAGAVVQSENTNDITMGSTPWVIESGFVAVGLFAHSGKGPHVLDNEIAAVRAAFHGWASDGLRILRVDGPLEVNPAVEGNWYQAAMQFAFEYQYRRSAVGPGFGDEQGIVRATGVQTAVGAAAASSVVTGAGRLRKLAIGVAAGASTASGARI